MGLFYVHNKTGVSGAAAQSTPKARLQLSKEIMEKMGCRACTLDRFEANLHHPKMRPTGTPKPYIYVLGEGPGKNEDEQGEQFIGKSGVTIRATIRDCLGLKDKDDENEWVRWNNVVRCRPPDNRAPTIVETTCCMPKQFLDIARTKPRVVLALGGSALEALIGEKGITAWRGRRIAYNRDGHACWIIPTFHPSYINRVSGKSNSKQERQLEDVMRFFRADIDRAVEQSYYGKPPQRLPSEAMLTDDIELVMRAGEIVRLLNRLDFKSYVATDLETTGYRPYHKGAAILTAAVSDGYKTYAFPIAHPEAGFSQAEIKQVLKAYEAFLLRHVDVWAHNLTFEMEWFRFAFGDTFVMTLEGHDTMAQAYVLDERQSAKSLDDLCLIHLGLRIKQLTALDKANLKEEPLASVLPYNGLDAKVTSLIAPRQHELLEADSLVACYDMHRKRSPTIAIMQALGVEIDPAAVEALHGSWVAKAAKAEKFVAAHPDVKKFSQRNGPLNIGSPKEVSKYFVAAGYSEMAGSSDEAALRELDDPVGNAILEYREAEKFRGTYTAPFLFEKRGSKGELIHARGKNIHDDGKVHTKFNHLLTSTGRLCVAEGTSVTIVNPETLVVGKRKIEDIVALTDYVSCVTSDRRILPRQVLSKACTGTRECIELKVECFDKIRRLIVTPDHRIRVPSGSPHYAAYMQASLLKPGNPVLVQPQVKDNGCIPSRSSSPVLGSVVSSAPAGTYRVWDLSIERDRNFYAAGICVHNSSTEPNLQNMPMRTHPEIRSMVTAMGKAITGIDRDKVRAESLQGEMMIVSADYGQIEARVIGMASEDEFLCKSLFENYDVHFEWAQRIATRVPRLVGGKAGLKDKDEMKKFRSVVKNKWTFPAFYLAQLSSIEKNLGCEENELRREFDDFWQQFAGVHAWQKRLLKFYKEHGYVECLTGRRRHGPMTPNMVVNSPIQGTASDIVVDGMLRLSKTAVLTDRMYLHPRLNVHDDLTFYMPVKNLDQSIDIMAEHMLMCPFVFINVPLTVEVKVGHNWHEMTEIATLRSEDYK